MRYQILLCRRICNCTSRGACSFGNTHAAHIWVLSAGLLGRPFRLGRCNTSNPVCFVSGHFRSFWGRGHHRERREGINSTFQFQHMMARPRCQMHGALCCACCGAFTPARQGHAQVVYATADRWQQDSFCCLCMGSPSFRWRTAKASPSATRLQHRHALYMLVLQVLSQKQKSSHIRAWLLRLLSRLR